MLANFSMKLLDQLLVCSFIGTSHFTHLSSWCPPNMLFSLYTFPSQMNQEDTLMNIDYQICNKSNIHENLSTMREAKIMEGDNKVLCNGYKIKTKTVLCTIISALHDVLVLSLKRFVSDYNMFETVKLNTRYEFDEDLNMKRYSCWQRRFWWLRLMIILNILMV